jgi:chemotaxis protein MotB
MAEGQTIVIKKIKKGGGAGHHGGAWKVAYADFVTAMMAFFLLMWLINTTTPEQKRGIADYFAPASVSPSTNGSGSILAGTAPGQDGVQGRGTSSVIERLSPLTPEDLAPEAPQAPQAAASPSEASEEAMQAARSRREDAQFENAEMSLRQALQDMPELAELSKHVLIDETPEGLRIQLVDQEGRPMFEPGSAEPTDRARTLLRAIANVVVELPNRVTISGHTDAAPAATAGYTNWELSADRANATRRLLETGGLDIDRIYQVSGKASSEPLFPDDPYMAGNRRISIVLLREAPVVPPDHRL